MPRFISCLPIFGCSKLFCEVSCLLTLEDVDSLGEFCCCCGCCSGDFLQFRRNFVRKPLSGGYAGYYRPLIRTHPRLFSLLLYQIPVEGGREKVEIDCRFIRQNDFTNKMKLVVKFFFTCTQYVSQEIIYSVDYINWDDEKGGGGTNKRVRGWRKIIGEQLGKI